MDLHFVFAWLAFLVSVVAYFPYVQGVLKSQTKPTLSTWIAWGIMDVAVLSGMIAKHTVGYQMVAYVIGVAAVIGVSVYKGASLGWKTIDSVCLSIVALSAVLWTVSQDPNVGIIFSLIAGMVATVPLAYNLWVDPHNEKMLPWILATVGSVCALLAVRQWTVAEALAPAVFVVLQVVIMTLLCRKYWKVAVA